MARSIEEQVELAYRDRLRDLGIVPITKTESMGSSIDGALAEGVTKSGGEGINRPDIRFWVDLGDGRSIPVMMEAKGLDKKLERLDKQGNVTLETEYTTTTKNHVKGELNWSFVKNYAVNGAVHYARVILDHSSIDAVIAIGINGCMRDGRPVFEHRAYWLSRDNGNVPKLMAEFDGASCESLDGVWPLLSRDNKDDLREYIDNLSLTDEEREAAKAKLESELELHVKRIHQRLYDSDDLRNLLETNQKLYLFCALIMAGLPAKGISPLSERDLHGNMSNTSNDGTVVLNQVESFLMARGNEASKVASIVSLLRPTLSYKAMWSKRGESRESLIKSLFRQVADEVLPYLTTNLRLDFTGKILNSLNEWVHIENDRANDVVLTPRFVTNFMARLARTNRDSFVWDSAMGSAGMLVSALEIMERDVRDNIVGRKAQEDKLDTIHKTQLLGIEILGNIYVLAVLNMILMGDGSSNIRHANSFEMDLPAEFPANVFLLNPPYSAPGKGLNFVARAVSKMEKGYACVLIQENAGSGNGESYASEILRRASLVASIHMPTDLFHGKSSVQTAIYLFKCGRPHATDDLVTFIDMSEDGYTRSNRRKSTSDVNLRDDGTAADRYSEVVARVLGKATSTEYYTEENRKLVRDTITLEGNDWTFGQHKKIETRPTNDEFRQAVADYLTWRLSNAIVGGA